MLGDEEDLDYQGLEERKRAQSRFICPSCNENTDYQRLSRLGHCPHERTEERRQKTASFYESLSHEGAARESLYARPSRGGEIVVRTSEILSIVNFLMNETNFELSDPIFFAPNPLEQDVFVDGGGNMIRSFFVGQM